MQLIMPDYLSPYPVADKNVINNPYIIHVGYRERIMQSIKNQFKNKEKFLHDNVILFFI